MLSLILSIFIKLMLINLYYSTDFDVHRNWMRLTQESIQEWYYDKQSIWTLDYPPLFAYLEYILGKIALLFQIDINSINQPLIIYQRITVIVTEVLYYFSLNQKSTFTKNLLVLMPFGALLIDNIHFQYNGFMYGLLLFSCNRYKKQDYLKASIIFSILLCFKHIYLYVVPAFAFYLLKNCKFTQIIKIGIQCIGIVFVIFLPFINHIPQILSRLFPFQRGLVHAYWAQNFWSIYCTIDKVIGKLLGINKANTASGIVQETVFNILPNINAIHTLILISIFCILVWKQNNIYQMATISSLIFFNFGFHVHEKAIMIPIILQLSYGKSPLLTFMASYINGISLMPLIPVDQYHIVASIFFIYHIIYCVEYELKFNKYQKLYLLVGIPILFSIQIQNYTPLLLHSVYGALFNQYWLYQLNKKQKEF
ncbi:glycosyl transferase [Paramecium bursaria]